MTKGGRPILGSNSNTAELPKVYDPKTVEDRWYRYWKEIGAFRAEVNPGEERFSMVIPPPNVTGSLHMGHALDNALQDVLARWKRMQGYNTLWLPGTDHAGIATQIKVEARLREEEGVTRHDLGREAFLERVWSWKEYYRDNIVGQLERLGASCDWSRERFTMDEGCSRAVRTVFVQLFEKGLIYQGNYIVHWCPNCQTTLSDLEVEHVDSDGHLWHIRYPFVDGSGEAVVATTRPETMLGDTAVAVNPEDERYAHLIGKMVRVPIVNREIPIIADEFVDPKFGTGMVKVTPSHDPNDFEMGQRHNLEQIKVIDLSANMTEAAGPYEGQDRYECRKRLVDDLKAGGWLVKVENHSHAVGHCYRCSTVVEPLLSRQWFVKMKPLAEPAIQVVKEGKVRFVPDRFSKNYLHWMENIRDWCISRQLWWGHRIPVWTCHDCGEVFAATEDPTQCSKCGGSHLEQDPDVLDTWFSSALWPFSTMGWPDKTPELDYFFPTNVLVTGWDIIYFWVARMIFMSLEMQDQPPFSDVIIHGIIRDSLGRKMSKSLGNGIDPLEVIDEYGADALRMTLLTGTAPGNDLRYYPEKVEASRNFANKVWNASRFALMNLEGFEPDGKPITERALELPDRWILSRYNWAVSEVTRHLNRYDFGEGARTLYDFVWSELCDWYVEIIKPRLYGHAGDESRNVAQHVLAYVLSHTVELLHPYMPFITEEIWQHLPHNGQTIMKATWPTPVAALSDPDAEERMHLIMEVVKAVRNVRAEKNVPPGKDVPAIALADDNRGAVLQANRAFILSLGRLSGLEVRPADSDKPERAVAAVAAGVSLYVPLADLVDVEAEVERLRKELAETNEQLSRSSARLTNTGFVQKAPAEVVEGARRRHRELEEQATKVKALLAELTGGVS